MLPDATNFLSHTTTFTTMQNAMGPMGQMFFPPERSSLMLPRDRSVLQPFHEITLLDLMYGIWAAYSIQTMVRLDGRSIAIFFRAAAA